MKGPHEVLIKRNSTWIGQANKSERHPADHIQPQELNPTNSGQINVCTSATRSENHRENRSLPESATRQEHHQQNRRLQNKSAIQLN